jgi:Zn-dependent protease with chaperone function
MTLPYYLRLLCLCLATFFVVHALAWLAISSVTRGAVRVAGTMKPRMATRFLFVLRITPSALALFLVLGFCIPSYVWLEPNLPTERVGWLCLAAAVLGGLVWVASLGRGMAAVVRTEQYVRHCGGEAASDSDMLVLPGNSPVMAVAGVVHPRLVVSDAVLKTLSVEQQDAAFRHEAAHQASRDNLKKLLFLLTPDVFPMLGRMGRLERAWATYTEWAADDQAVDGDQDRALSLASALVKVAKLGVSPSPSYLLSTLMDTDRDLEVRVDRLLRKPAYAEKPLAPVVAFLRNVGMVASAIGVTLLLWPESLGSVHRLLEQLVQ